jgi:AraC-like DNA-binding protein
MIAHETVLTLPQALQLVGLVPCVFVACFLLSLLSRDAQTVIPLGYFLALACAFALPLVDIFLPQQSIPLLKGGLLLGESTLVAFGFLLIYQFLTGEIPPIPYWLVLAIPLIGGGSLTYASSIEPGELCFSGHICPSVSSLKTLYEVLASSLVFLLLVTAFSRMQASPVGDAARRHKYWLIIALIMLNLLLLVTELAQLAGQITAMQADLIVTVFRLSFIYLVLTSLFRVFYPDMGTQVVQMMVAKKPCDPEAEQPYVEKITLLLENDHVYRGMNLNRARLAALAGISEYHLSRVINNFFGKSFNELINSYRVEEAKRRLQSEPTQITIIGFEAGFNSIASFNRVFKTMTGMSPSEYRAQAAPGVRSLAS